MTIRIALLALASPLALIAVPAAAQNEPPAAAPEAEGEIVVTAQLVEQNASDVPFALTAYSGEFLDQVGITEFDRLGQFTPGFDVQNQSPNNPGFVMRGITSDSGSAFNEPRVSVFQDGVSISKSRGSYVELFDLERVEIAKGPQSTLYGRGALIGAVNLVQAKADPERAAGMVEARYGNFDFARADMMVNLPLGSDLAFRAAARIRERDGYIPNLLGGKDFNGIQSEAVRASLRWAPERFTFDLIGNYQHDRATGTSFKSNAYNPTNPTTGAVIGDRSPNTGAALAPGAGFEGGKPLGLDRDVWGVTGIANYEISDNLALNAIGSYRKFAGIEVFDPDGISLPILTAAEDARGDQTMATLRLTYSDDRLTAFVGGTWFREEGSQRVPLQFDERLLLARAGNALNGAGFIPGRPASDPAPLGFLTNTAFVAGALQQTVAQRTGLPLATVRALVLPDATAAGIANNLSGSYRETSTNSSRTKSFDLFGDVTFKVTDRFEIGGGIRYTHDDKITGYSSAVTNGRSVLGMFLAAQQLGIPFPVLATPGLANAPVSPALPLIGLFTQATAGNGNRITQGLKDSGFTWRAVARYELSDDVNLYANYARGRRPGILSVSGPAVPFGAPQFELIPSETVDSFEVGAKTALANRTLFLDASVFYYRYNNFQTTEQQGTQFVTINAGKATSYGAEVQFRWNPTSWAQLFGTYAYNHSRFDVGARDGNHFRLSPDHSASLGGTFTAHFEGVKVDFTPSISWQSKVFFDDDNDLPALQADNLIPDTIQDELQKGYALADLRLGVETADGRWRIEGFVNNVFDEKYIKDAGNTGDGLGMPTFIAGEPRMYGVAVRLKIGE